MESRPQIYTIWLNTAQIIFVDRGLCGYYIVLVYSKIKYWPGCSGLYPLNSAGFSFPETDKTFLHT